MNLSPFSLLIGTHLVSSNIIIIIIIDLFDVEYYCDLEMWVRGH